jgi:non-canonical purine NTP pyrophosphatase (RdgB/HAM1 family)
MITFVTGNENKLREVRIILGRPDLPSVNLEGEELQDQDLERVARRKVTDAFLKFQGPVLVEDVFYHLEAMRGLPGANVKDWGERGMYEVVLENIRAQNNDRALTRCAVAYKDADLELVVIGEVPGRHIPRSGMGWGFSPYFAPDGHDGKTYADLGPAIQNTISHRAVAWRMMRDELAKHGITL